MFFFLRILYSLIGTIFVVNVFDSCADVFAKSSAQMLNLWLLGSKAVTTVRPASKFSALAFVLILYIYIYVNIYIYCILCTPFSNHSNIIEDQLGRPVTHILGAELLIGFIDKNAESESAACIVVKPWGEDEKSMNFSVIISVPERRALYLYNMIHDAKKHLGQHNTSNITCTDCFKLLETVMGILAFSPADLTHVEA